MRKFTDEEFDLLERHFWVIRVFGFEWWIWNTSPKRVLEHLKELKVRQAGRKAAIEWLNGLINQDKDVDKNS